MQEEAEGNQCTGQSHGLNMSSRKTHHMELHHKIPQQAPADLLLASHVFPHMKTWLTNGKLWAQTPDIIMLQTITSQHVAQ